MKIAGFLSVILLSFRVAAQAIPTDSSLHIGDKMPDLFVTSISNYKNQVLHFSDLKGKLVILDFWGINCSPCMKAFPKLEALQSKFSGQIQIVCVTSPSKSWLDSVVQKRRVVSPGFKLSSLPLISGDTLLNRLFPHNSIPHYVWINSAGIISAITESDEVNEVNVKKFFQNRRTILAEKKDLIDISSEKPLFPQLSNRNIAVPKFYSMLFENVNGLAGGTTWFDRDSVGRTIRMTRANYTIIDFYVEALLKRLTANPYESAEFDFGKRVVLMVKDSSRFLFDSSGGNSYKDWRSKNSYCYETIMPEDQFSKRYQHYFTDLNKYFGVDAKIETRRMKCFAIVRTSSEDKLRGSVEKERNLSYVDSMGVYHLTGLGEGLYSFRNKLAEVYKLSPYIVVDQTGYTGKVNLEIHAPLDNIKLLKQELRNRYDLDIVQKEAEVDMMIIMDK